jgi:hypothetical protein
MCSSQKHELKCIEMVNMMKIIGDNLFVLKKSSGWEV